MSFTLRTFAVVLAVAAGACTKDGGSPATGSAGSQGAAAPAASPRDAVLDAWKANKLAPSAMAPATVAFAKDCQGGTVAGVDALLCSFPSPAEAKSAEDQGLTWVGSATGASLARGQVLVMLADRKKADPNGRTINQLLKLAPN
jgi:predicted phage tail protein